MKASHRRGRRGSQRFGYLITVPFLVSSASKLVILNMVKALLLSCPYRPVLRIATVSLCRVRFGGSLRGFVLHARGREAGASERRPVCPGEAPDSSSGGGIVLDAAISIWWMDCESPT